MAIKAVGATDPVQVYSKPAYARQGRPFHVVNLDLASPVYYDDNVSVDGQSNVIYPLGRAGFDGSSDVFMSTVTPGVSVLVQALPGHTAWDPGPVQTAAAIQRTGVPPVVPGLTSVSMIGQGAGGGGVFFTFPAGGGLIYGGHLSFAAGADSSYTGGVTQLYARIKTGSGVDLTVIELAVAGPNTSANGDSDINMPGRPVTGGDTLVLDPNNNVALVNGVFHASCVVYYSLSS